MSSEDARVGNISPERSACRCRGGSGSPRTTSSRRPSNPAGRETEPQKHRIGVRINLSGLLDYTSGSVCNLITHPEDAVAHTPSPQTHSWSVFTHKHTFFCWLLIQSSSLAAMETPPSLLCAPTVSILSFTYSGRFAPPIHPSISITVRRGLVHSFPSPSPLPGPFSCVFSCLFFAAGSLFTGSS